MLSTSVAGDHAVRMGRPLSRRHGQPSRCPTCRTLVVAHNVKAATANAVGKRSIFGVMPTSAQRRADLVIVPMSFLDAPAEQRCRPARSAQSERPHPRPYATVVRNRELRCEERHGRPEGEPHPCQRFTAIPSPRIG